MGVPEMPLVVSDEVEEKITKTKEAVALLKALGLSADLSKVISSKKIRTGRGKARNRRYQMRKGPLVVLHELKEESKLAMALRNIPGVDVACVDRLNLLELAPGGCFGRMVVYTESAVKRLGGLFGTYKGGSQEKKGYTLPRSIMTNADIARIINSNEVQAALEPAKAPTRSLRQRKNPLKNQSVLGRMCPWALTEKKRARLAHVKGSKVQLAQAKKNEVAKAAKKKVAKNGKVFFKALSEAHKVVKAAPKEEEEVVEDDEE